MFQSLFSSLMYTLYFAAPETAFQLSLIPSVSLLILLSCGVAIPSKVCVKPLFS